MDPYNSRTYKGTYWIQNQWVTCKTLPPPERCGPRLRLRILDARSWKMGDVVACVFHDFVFDTPPKTLRKFSGFPISPMMLLLHLWLTSCNRNGTWKFLNIFHQTSGMRISSGIQLGTLLDVGHLGLEQSMRWSECVRNTLILGVTLRKHWRHITKHPSIGRQHC
jgi:hypothetical protein